MKTKRNAYLISKAIKNFLFASILTMAISQLNVTVDGIIVSHLIEPDAMSAINLFTPISLAITSICTFLGIGATILASRYIGERKPERVNDVLATALTSVVAAGILIAVIVGIYQESLIDFICLEDRLRDYFHEYALIMTGCSGIVMLSMLFNKIAAADGKPELVARAVTISALTNIVLDYVFIAWFHMGISGSAWASVLALVVNIACLARQQFGEHRAMFLHPFRGCSRTALKENLLQGTPMVISNLVLMLMFFLLNNLVQSRQGADGMFVLSICMNLLSLGMMFSGGIGSAVLAIGAFLHGQQDFRGVRMLVKRCVGWLMGCLAAVVVLVQIYPDALTLLFGANTPELVAYTNHCLRIFVWMLPTILLILLLANVYQMQGFLALPPLLILAFPVVLLPSLWLWAEYAGNDHLWFAFPETGVLVLGIALLVTEGIRRKKPELQPLTLVSRKDPEKSFDSSIQANAASLQEALAGLMEYFRQLEVDPALARRINLCLEEVMLNVVEHSGKHMEHHFFDLHITIVEGKLTASVKDDGRPFNPLLLEEKYQGNGLKILHGYCQDLSYNYMYGQNMTFMKWEIKL